VFDTASDYDSPGPKPKIHKGPNVKKESGPNDNKNMFLYYTAPGPMPKIHKGPQNVQKRTRPNSKNISSYNRSAALSPGRASLLPVFVNKKNAHRKIYRSLAICRKPSKIRVGTHTAIYRHILRWAFFSQTPVLAAPL